MFDEDSNQKGKDNRGDKKPTGGFNLPVSGLLVWVIIVAVMIGLFFMKGRYSTPANEIQQAEFLEKFDTNQIANATIVINQQALPPGFVSPDAVDSFIKSQIKHQELIERFLNY